MNRLNSIHYSRYYDDGPTFHQDKAARGDPAAGGINSYQESLALINQYQRDGKRFGFILLYKLPLERIRNSSSVLFTCAAIFL